MKPSPVIHFDFSKVRHSRYRIYRWESIADLAISVASLIFFAPVILTAALYIRLVSRGPVIFKQERVGLNGKSFVIFKLRTMYCDTSTEDHETHTTNLIRNGHEPMVKLDAKGDVRLIPLGRFIRAVGIDELPQLINVFRREMSIVGPRPCVISEYSEYDSRGVKRFNTLPGLTGLWQVSGKNELTFAEMIDLDLRYVSRKSLPLYFSIILRTPYALVRQLVQCRNHQTRGKARPSDFGNYRRDAVGQ